MDRAELIIKLTGDKEALSSLSNLEKAMKNLNNSKAQLRVDKSLVDREIADVQAKLKALRSDRKINVMLGMETGSIDAEIVALTQRLNELTERRRSVQLDVSDINLAQSGLRDARQEAENFLNALSSVFDGLSGISRATADFAESIGNAFSGMSSAFKTNVFDYIEQSLTYLATKSLVGDFSKITQRYDIMSTFTQYMEAAGVASDESAAALQRVNDAILGLPIGLDEAAYRLRRYQMFLGDINDATSLTIGLQNALLAGGASEQMRNTAYQQIDRLLSAGKLNTSRQWLALIQGLGVSLKYVTQEMGVTNLTTREFAAGLTSGRISTNEFLRALMNLGNGTSQAARELDGLLEIYKTTLESWLSNIRFAAVRGGETILKSLNKSLMDSTDMGIVDYLKMIRDAMNDFYRGTGEFITGNPELIRQMSDSIGGLMDAFSRFSASDTATMVFNNLTRGVDLLTQALNMLPVDETQQFFAFAVTLAGPLGKLFDIVSSGAPYMLAVFERFKDFDFEHLLERIIEEVDRLARVYETLLNLLGDDVLTELITFGLVYGSPAAKGFSAISDGLMGLASALIVLQGLTPVLGTLSAGIAALAGAGATIAGIVGALAVADGVRRRDLGAELGVKDMTLEEIQAEIDRLKANREDLDPLTARPPSGSGMTSEEFARRNNDTLRVLEAQKKALEDQQAALTSTGDTAAEAATGLDAFAEAANNATEATKEAADTTQTLESRLMAAQDAISLAAQELSGVWAKQVDLFSEMGEVDAVAFADLEKALKSNADAFTAYQENAEKAARFVASHPELGTAASELFQSVVSGGLEDAGLLDALVDKFENDYDGFLEYLAEYIRTSELNLTAQDWAAMLGAGLSPEDLALYISANYGPVFTEALEQAFTMMGESDANRAGFDSMLEGMLQGGYGDSSLALSLPDRIKEIAKETGGAMAEGMAEGAAEADMTEVGHAAAENAVNATTAALQEADYTPIATTISEKLTEALTAAFTDANLLGVIFNLEDLTALQEAFVLLTETLTTFTVESILPFNEQVTLTNEGLTVLYTDAMLPVEELTVLFYETHLPELNTSLLELIATITELISALDELIARLEDARRRTDDLRNAVRDLGNTIQSKIPVVYEFSGAINGITSAAQEAAAAVAELAAAIASLESAEITVGAHVAGTTQAAGPRALPFSNGGPVYLARGGVFKPRGTDTVPAMLTPGEFVMNRSAVKAFGLDFMKRINSIDFGAAVQAMYRRMPTMAGFVPIYNVQNRNDNRHIDINQYIYEADQRYSQRMMSRWAHAL